MADVVLLHLYFLNWLSQSNTPSSESAYAVATNDHIELLQSVSQQLGSNSSLNVPHLDGGCSHGTCTYLTSDARLTTNISISRLLVVWKVIVSPCEAS